MRHRPFAARFHRTGIAIAAVILAAFATVSIVGASGGEKTSSSLEVKEPGNLEYSDLSLEALVKELGAALVRLPLAAALGAALALRPRRRGTPVRQMAVIETQIVLAIVGAVIMLVVGASLARAFGIVGVASLIRYRSKIDDPKDAVVMLSALAVGLSAGVGLYGLGIFSTLFLVAALWVIEGFEPRTRAFELSVKLGDKTGELRPKIEAVLRRNKVEYELRGASEEEASYLVTVPHDASTERVSEALTGLAPDDKGAVEWSEKPKTKSK